MSADNSASAGTPTSRRPVQGSFGPSGDPAVTGEMPQMIRYDLERLEQAIEGLGKDDLLGVRVEATAIDDGRWEYEDGE